MTPRPLLDVGRDLRASRPVPKRRPGAALPRPAVTARALALEDDCAAVGVAGSDGAPAGGRLEDLRLREGERRHDDAAPDDDRSPASAHQKPNRTFVKYQRLEVSQRTTSIDASVSPAVGQRPAGSERSRTISTFATKTP